MPLVSRRAVTACTQGVPQGDCRDGAVNWMLFFSVQPPDRVGIIRRLRFGMSVKANGDGFDLDLSNMRFKNSKFYGVSERRVECNAAAACL